MIYQRLASFPALKLIYSYLHIIAAAIQIVSIFFLYPGLYPIFDGVTTFTFSFIASSSLIVVAYIIQNLSVCFCEKSKSLISIVGAIISYISSVLLFVGGIIYSPLIGHQEDREHVFIIGEGGFIIYELTKIWRFYKENNNRIQFFAQNSHNELGMSLFAGFSWLSQLIGTLFFVYSVYNQQLLILGVFFYGISSILWGIRTWILTQNIFQRSVGSNESNKNEPQMKRLYKRNAPIQ